MKRILAILFVVVLAINLPLRAKGISLASSELQNEENIATTVYSEALDYLAMKKMSDEELKEHGFTIEEIEEFHSFSYESELLKRASYSDEVLHRMGYSDEQIRILRDYDGSALTEDNPVMALTAECVGKFKFIEYDADVQALYFRYEFEWTFPSAWAGTDTVAVSWQAVDENGYFLSCSTFYRACTIRYFCYFDETPGDNIRYDLTPMSGFNGYQASFPCEIDYDGALLNDYYWRAKSGTVTYALKVDGNQTINLVKAYGAVGHKTCALNPSLTITPGSSQVFTFSFGPTYAYDTVGVANYTIKRDGSCYSN